MIEIKRQADEEQGDGSGGGALTLLGAGIAGGLVFDFFLPVLVTGHPIIDGFDLDWGEIAFFGAVLD